jgi:hypothetical protein
LLIGKSGQREQQIAQAIEIGEGALGRQRRRCAPRHGAPYEDARSPRPLQEMKSRSGGGASVARSMSASSAAVSASPDARSSCRAFALTMALIL